MALKIVRVTTPSEPVLANVLESGVVFTGDLWEGRNLMFQDGVFLKSCGHVICLTSFMLFGAGATSSVRVVNYVSWPQSYLTLIK